MINKTGADVIVHVPVSCVTIRWDGVERKVFQMGQGFAQAEFGGDDIYPISNPLENWIQTVAAGVEQAGSFANVYFIFEPEGKRGNPGQDDEARSLTDLQVAI